MTSQRSTGWIDTLAAGTHPRCPFGRPESASLYHFAFPSASSRTSTAITQRGWKSGRNCSSVLTTGAVRDGFVLAATAFQAICPEPTTRMLASALGVVATCGEEAPSTGATPAPRITTVHAASNARLICHSP